MITVVMNKILSWKILLGCAVIAYILPYVIGGFLGALIKRPLELLSLVTFLMGIVAIFQRPKL